MKPAGNKHFTIDVFGSHEVLVISTAKGMRQFINENFGDDEERANEFIESWEGANGAVHLHFFDGVPYTIIIISHKSHRVVVHESVHCASLVMNQKGIPMSIDNDEVMAYLTDYIFSEVCRIVGLGVK